MLTEQQKQDKARLIAAIQKDDLLWIKNLLRIDQYFIDDEVIKSIPKDKPNSSDIFNKIETKLKNNSKSLYQAISDKNEAAVQRICDLGFDKNFISPKKNKNFDSKGANQYPDSLLTKAIKSGNANIVKMLIEAGVDVNQEVEIEISGARVGFGVQSGPVRGPSPLLLAINLEDNSIKKVIVDSLLCSKSIILNKTFNMEEITVFDYAKGQPEIEKLLFKKLQDKRINEETLSKIEQKYFNKYMQNAMSDIFKEVVKEVKVKPNDLEANNKEAFTTTITTKIEDYLLLDKDKKAELKKDVETLYDSIVGAKKKSKNTSQNKGEAISKLFDKLFEFFGLKPIEKKAFKDLKIKIEADLIKPDSKKVDAQATQPPLPNTPSSIDKNSQKR
ncbi:MAG: hypothetical protein ACK4OM_07565 [Alphaproteobacteria bacterium]